MLCSCFAVLNVCVRVCVCLCVCVCVCCFPALATIQGTIVAVDAGTCPAGMAMAGVVESGACHCSAMVASEEAPILLLCSTALHRDGCLLAGPGLRVPLLATHFLNSIGGLDMPCA